jgi:tripartite-type tricarboxylate transporter receptor subunit TctC
MLKSFYKLSILAVIFMICISFAGLATAKDVTVVVPYPVGGMADTGVRILAPYLEKYLGENVVVINKPGAGGELGYNYVAKAKTDGYTLGYYIVPGAQGAQATRNTTFSNDDFAYIGSQMSDPHVLVVRRDDERFPNLKALIEYMKNNGKKTKIGIPNKFDDDDWATTKFTRAFGVDGTRISSGKSASPGARKQLMGGYTDFHINNTLLWQGYVGEDQPLKILAYLWGERVDSLDPNAPTVVEATGVELISATYRGFITQAKVSAERLAKLRAAFEKAMKDPDCIADSKKRRLPIAFTSGEGFENLVYETQKQCDEFWKNK